MLKLQAESFEYLYSYVPKVLIPCMRRDELIFDGKYGYSLATTSIGLLPVAESQSDVDV